jgi:putative addiction module CopG family antidote
MPETPKSLNVSLTPELTRFITSRVASGRYQSASEVVRAALRLLEREEAGMLPERLSTQPQLKRGQASDE